jgi:hypothetical protein
MTSKRRHPAQASRILATGLSAATLLSIVAVLGAQPPAGAPEAPVAITPARVTVAVGDPGAKPLARRATTQHAAARRATPRQATAPRAAQRPHTSTGPS